MKHPLSDWFWQLGGAMADRIRAFAPRVTAIIIIAAACFLVVMAASLYQRLERINAAESDNLIWVFAQLEVDAIKLDLAAADLAYAKGEAQRAESQTGLRRAFDIYYSRILVVESGMIHLENDPQMATIFNRVRWTRDRLDKIIAGIEQTSSEDLLALRDMTRANSALARDLSVTALQNATSISTIERKSQRYMLIAYLAVTATLIAVMALSLAVVLYLSHKLKSRTMALTRLASNLSKMIEAANDAVVVVDRGGHIIQYNASAERIFGHARSDAVGARLSDLLIPERYRARHNQGMRIYQSTGRSRIINGARAVLSAINVQGQEFPCEVSVVSDTDIDGNPIYVSFVRDISQRLEAERKLEDALQQARRDAAAKSRFLAVMSHEMRTPLHGMIASLDMIDITQVGTKDRKLMQTARACSRDALEQIEDILDIARQEASGDYQRPKIVFSPTRIAIDMATSLKPRADKADTVIRVIAPDTGSPKAFSGDARSFHRALQNLVVNALKFTDQGLVEIELSCASKACGKSTLRVEVSDTGCGIPKAEQVRIFEDFESSGEQGGTGLGLGIVRRCVERMNGTNGMRSVEGDGSVFWFEIELEDAVHPLLIEDPELRPLTRALPVGMKVLIVDDNPVNLALMEEMLARLGCRVTAAHDGMNAVEYSKNTMFDLILLDINMPYMDGVETATEIKRAGYGDQAIFIAVTAMVTEEDKQRLHEIGINDIVTKPLGPAELTRRLRDILHKPEVGKVHAPASAETESNTAGISQVMYDAVGQDVANRFAAAIRADVKAVIEKATEVDDDLIDDNLADLAHRAAGSAALAGMSDLRDVLIAIETAARSGEGLSINEKILYLRQHLLSH